MRIECPKCGERIALGRVELPAEGLQFPCPSCSKPVQIVPRAAWVARGPGAQPAGADGPSAAPQRYGLAPSEPAPFGTGGDLLPGQVTPGPAGSWRFSPPPRPRSASPAADQPVVAVLSRSRRQERPTPRTWFFAGMGALLIVAGLGAAGAIFVAGATRPASARAYQARIAAWALAEPRPEGTTERWLEEGRAALALGTAASLAQARTAFRRAAVLDPTRIEAAAGWVESTAWTGRDAREPQAQQTMRDLARHLLAEAEEEPAVRRAWATALAAWGDHAGARPHALFAVERSGGDPAALLALARVELEANDPVRAAALADEALRSTAAFPLALRVRGLARAQLGDGAGAAADLRRRIEVDPADAAAFRAFAAVALALGAEEEVRALGERLLAFQPEEAALQLATVALQVDGDRARARALLDPLLRRGVGLGADLHARVLALALAEARSRGDRAGAAALAARADPAASPLLARALALHALDTGDLAEAERLATGFAAADGSRAAAFEAALLLGRIDLAAGRVGRAIERFQVAHARDPARPEPLLLRAAAEARHAGPGAAIATLHLLSNLDPARLRPAPGPFHEDPRVLLAGLHEPFLGADPNDPAGAPLLAGAALFRHHQGEPAEAAALAARSLRLDPQGPLALAVEAQLALDRGEARRALVRAGRLSRAERLSPAGPFLEGRAQEALGKFEAAKASYLLALEREIAYLPAQRRLDALNARRGDAEARFLDRLGRGPLEASSE